MALVTYAGMTFEEIRLEDDPDYRKLQAIGYAIARFEKEIRQEKAQAAPAK